MRITGGRLRDLTIVYSEAPQPTPTLGGFNGAVISGEYTYVYPNPTRKSPAKFSIYSLEPARITLKIYNISSQLVYSRELDHNVAGNIEIHWDFANIANGVYIYKITAAGLQSGKKESVTKKLAIVRE